MFFRSLTIAAVVALGLIQGQPAQAQQFQIAVDGEFQEETLRFTGGIAPPYTFVWDIRLVDGQVAMCGSGRLRDPRLGTTIRQILRGSEVTANGQVYPVDLNYFTRARSIDALRSQPATCQIVAPYSGGNVSFRLGSGTWRN